MTPALAHAAATPSTFTTLPLVRRVPTVLATGAFLKNTLCLIHADRATFSADNGNLETLGSVRAFEAAAEQLLGLPGELPRAVAHDLHPDFHSTRWAEALASSLGIEAVAVQHHHAHVAAVMAEHGCEQDTLGLALDGFGLGPGNQAWGGELLLVGPGGYRRLGHLRLLPQPGGDRAAREPWRMASAALHLLGRGDEIAARFDAQKGAPLLVRMLQQGVNCPMTSSAGRLFDAACGLLGVKLVASFEGEAPMQLEQLATRPVVDPEGFRLGDDGVLDLLPLLDRLASLPADEGANLFHGTLAAALAAWVVRAAETTGVRRVVLSGGCFLNRVLSAALEGDLQRHALSVLRPIRLAPGDSAISLGQAWAVAMADR